MFVLALLAGPPTGAAPRYVVLGAEPTECGVQRNFAQVPTRVRSVVRRFYYDVTLAHYEEQRVAWERVTREAQQHRPATYNGPPQGELAFFRAEHDTAERLLTEGRTRARDREAAYQARWAALLSTFTRDEQRAARAATVPFVCSHL